MSDPRASYPAGGYSGVYYPPGAYPPGQPGGYPGPAGPPLWPAPAPAPARPRRRGRTRTVLCWLVGLLAFAAVRGVYAVAAHDVIDRPATNAAGVSHAGDLRALLLDRPTGARSWKQPLGTDESLSAEEDAATTNDTTSRLDALRRYHFSRGAVRCWAEPSGFTTAVMLLQFGGADEAARFAGADQRGTVKAHPGATGEPSGVPHGLRVVDKTPDADGSHSAFAIAARGDVVVVIVAALPGPGQPDRLDQLTRAQYDRL
jgi:hypothetical protein